MSSKLKVTPLGGLGEIGMNCMVLEYEDEMLVVDCGLLFSDLDHFGVEFVIPDFRYIRERKDKLKGYILTHGHEDHVGALPFALKSGLKAPVFCSPFTSLLVTQRLKEYGLDTEVDLRPFKIGTSFGFKHFKIETVSVNHSIIDACALIITTPAGKVVHTGDFKIDANPFYGSRIDESAFRRAGDDGVLLLLSDSTNVERCSHTPSESLIYQKFEQLFAAAEGLTVVATFASNISRLGQVFELAEKMGKRVAVAGRSMDQNTRLAMESGLLKGAASTLITLDEAQGLPRDRLIVLSSGSQAELGSALLRCSNAEHKLLTLGPGDLVIMSSRSIPGNEKAIGRMINNLFKQGAQVLYEAVHEIHVSGHATRPELKMMIEWTRPKFFVPIHGEYRHLVHHASVARETGMSEDHIKVISNGDVLEISKNEAKVVERLEEQRVLVADRAGTDISKDVLKERRQLGEKGVVFALLVRDEENGKILSGPEVITRGLANEDMEMWLVEEARDRVKKVVREWEKIRRQRTPENDLEETIRIELRRFFNDNIGKKPVVLPIVMEV